MRSQICLILAATALVLSMACPLAIADDNGAAARSALENLEKWLSTSPSGKGWTDYLKLTPLKAEIAKGADADRAVIAQTHQQLQSGAPGLELPQFTQLRSALGQWSSDLLIAKAGLPQAVAESESGFRPITDADVAAAKADLEKAVARLEKFLAFGGANGTAWKNWLHLADLQAQLKSPAPDAKVLKSVQTQFRADQNGLEMAKFSDVAKALERYLLAMEGRRDDLRTDFAAQLKGLSEELQQYDKDLAGRGEQKDDAERVKASVHSEEAASAVGSRLGWLESMQQSLPLVNSVRSRYSRPNLRVGLSERLVAAGVDQSVDDVAPVRDVILGTNISGTGRTVGRISLELVPSDQRAEMEIQLTGQTLTNTVGRNGPATICANGTTQIAGRKRVQFDQAGLNAMPASASASTSTQITGISAGRGGLIQRIATKKVYQSKAEAEQIGSSHAADRVRERVDAQAMQQLSKAQADYLQKFRNPLVRRGQFPDLLTFNTTGDYLTVVARGANTSQLAAPTKSPAVKIEHDLAVRLHESMVNNMAWSMLAGLTLKQEDMEAKVIELRGSLPEQLKSDADRDPWSITFANQRPVTIAFFDNGFQLTIRGQRYTSGTREFKAMNVTANYKVEIHGSGAKLVRQGDLEILPPGFVRGGGKSLTTQQVSLKALLQKKFGKMLEPEMVYEGLVLPGQWEKAGRLDLKQLDSDAGWLVLAFIESGVHPEPKPKVAAAGVAGL